MKIEERRFQLFRLAVLCGVLVSSHHSDNGVLDAQGVPAGCPVALTDEVAGVQAHEGWNHTRVTYSVAGLTVAGSPERTNDAQAAAAEVFRQWNAANSNNDSHVQFVPAEAGETPDLVFKVPSPDSGGIPGPTGDTLHPTRAAGTRATAKVGNQLLTAEINIDLNGAGYPGIVDCGGQGPANCKFFRTSGTNSEYFSEAVQLVLKHEIGHTMGLGHARLVAGNYGSSVMLGGPPNNMTTIDPVTGERVFGGRVAAGISNCDRDMINRVFSKPRVSTPGSGVNNPNPGQGFPTYPSPCHDSDFDGFAAGCEGANDCDDTAWWIHPMGLQDMCNLWDYAGYRVILLGSDDINCDGIPDWQQCSGDYSYSSFQFPTISPDEIYGCEPGAGCAPHYMGCYWDDGDRALDAWFGNGFTVESCIETARANGYVFAGLQFFGHCFAGNDLGYSQVDESECNTPCDANNFEFCGGGWRNSIYSSGLVAIPYGVGPPTGGGGNPNAGGPGRLDADQVIQPEQALYSPDGRFRLRYQSDDNLVLYVDEWTPVWQFGVDLWWEHTPGYAIMQGDGNFVVYDSEGVPVFNTGTFVPGSFLAVQNDGNLVVYAPDWTPLWSIW
jgi:hypothetical protein